MSDNNDIMIIDEETLRSKVHVIRGQQVMLDSDLAEIYGYTTKAFNQQVKNNIAKFPEDFRFQLTAEEVSLLSRSNILTSMQTSGTRGGRAYLPYVFTEQGIYMLMSVLRGDLATRQSIVLIRLFKSMKDHLIENQPLLTQKDYFALVRTVESHSQDIRQIRNDMVSKADLSDFIKLFERDLDSREILILDGEPFKADEAYQRIYNSANRSIVIIDDYIGLKTLQHLAHAKQAVRVTIISDNLAKPRLTLTEYQDFQAENRGRIIAFLRSQRQSHDRYIVLDEGTKNMRLYHCGASSKDAGKRITTITRLQDIDDYKPAVQTMLGNAPLLLK